MDQHHLQPCSDEDSRPCSTPETAATLPWSEFTFPASGGHSHLFRSLHTANTCSRSSLTGATVAFSKLHLWKLDPARKCLHFLRTQAHLQVIPRFCHIRSSESMCLTHLSPFLFLLLSFFFCFFKNRMSLVWVEFAPDICVDAAYSWIHYLFPQIQATYRQHFKC